MRAAYTPVGMRLRVNSAFRQNVTFIPNWICREFPFVTKSCPSVDKVALHADGVEAQLDVNGVAEAKTNAIGCPGFLKLV